MPFDGTQLSPVAKNLVDAKQYILDHGWSSKGPRFGGTVCMVIAVRAAGDVFEASSVGFLAKAVGVRPLGPCVGRWNDSEGRTLDEVLKAFDDAIALAMAEGK